jgi:hypothetical protein
MTTGPRKLNSKPKDCATRVAQIRYNGRSVRVRRQGLEPRTPRIRVRCSGAFFSQLTSTFTMLLAEIYRELPSSMPPFALG